MDGHKSDLSSWNLGILKFNYILENLVLKSVSFRLIRMEE